MLEKLKHTNACLLYFVYGTEMILLTKQYLHRSGDRDGFYCGFHPEFRPE